MIRKPRNALVLLSGGMDSVTLLHYVRQRLLDSSEDLYTVSFNYGQRHPRELEAASYQSILVEAKAHFEIKLPIFNSIMNASALLDPDRTLPSFEEARDSETQPSTYVPFRNTILLSIACAYAEVLEVRRVYYAAQESDYRGYWDCRPEYVDALNGVTKISPIGIMIHAPFVLWTKFRILKEGIDLGVDYSHTWSCYAGGDLACGKCPSCVSRMRAFLQLEIPDPLEYEGG